MGIYLELQTTLHVLLQRLGDGLVKVAEDLHRQLRVDTLLADQVIEGICQSETDAAAVSPGTPQPRINGARYLLRR